MAAIKLIEYNICISEPGGIGLKPVTGQPIKGVKHFALRNLKGAWALDHIPTGLLVLKHRLKSQCVTLARELSTWPIYMLFEPDIDRLDYMREIMRSQHFVTFEEYLQLR